MQIEPDAAYMVATRKMIAEALANGGPVDDEMDAAQVVLDTVADAGLVLVTQADYQDLMAAYVMQAIR